MFTLIADHQLTRRKRTHHVLDEKDVLIFTSPDLRECLEFILEEGQHKFELHAHLGPALYLTIEPEDEKPPPSITACPDDPI